MAGTRELVTYRGYRLNVYPHGNGCKVFIYQADGMVSEPTVPSTMVFADRNSGITEAKLIIDRFFSSLSLDEEWPKK